jgi:hypothetical protein
VGGDDQRTRARVPNPVEQYIGYRLNILGVRVWKDRCQLIARRGDQWMPLGPSRPLPVKIPHDPAQIGTDTLLLTALQFDAEQPGSDIREVLAQTKDFETALRDGLDDSRAAGSSS